jgi:hypothetical protein
MNTANESSPGRRRTLELSAAVFVLGGGVLSLLPGALFGGSIALLDRLQREQRGVFVATVILPTLLMGMLMGMVAWVLCLRRWFSLPEMMQPMMGPRVPIISGLAQRLVRYVYNFGNRPSGTGSA